MYEPNFTRQEGIVLGLLSRGYTNADIMERLYITKNTLKTHMRNIFWKIGVNDRTQAAIWGVKHNYGQTRELVPFKKFEWQE
jgi:DNA-binding NarL/FixJ family response regulator